jgi:hypothetical protein
VNDISLIDTEILKYIYSKFVDIEDYPLSGIEKKYAAKVFQKFVSLIEKEFGKSFIQNIRKIRTNSNELVTCKNENSYGIYQFAMGDEEYCKEEIITAIALDPEAGIDFLFAFNLKHDLLDEISICNEDEQWETASKVISATYEPENFNMLAAGIDLDMENTGYLLKNWEFQGYTFSIYKEGSKSYSFEFISLHEGFKSKILCVIIVDNDGVKKLIEEECKIDTKQYSIQYNGVIKSDTEIKPCIYIK